MEIPTRYPRIYFDGNCALADNVFGLVQGAIDDLRALGLTPETALGSPFTFVQEDVGPNDEPDALIFNGTIALSPTLWYVAQVDQAGVHWLSELTGNEA